jgi:hypothetical protein
VQWIFDRKISGSIQRESPVQGPEKNIWTWDLPWVLQVKQFVLCKEKVDGNCFWEKWDWWMPICWIPKYGWLSHKYYKTYIIPISFFFQQNITKRWHQGASDKSIRKTRVLISSFRLVLLLPSGRIATM